MARVVMQAVVSVDGFIAYPDDTVGPLFDWYGNGDTEVSAGASGWTFHVSRTSADYVQPFWDAIKVTVIGRHLFDTTNGWDGKPAAGDELVVVTHRPLPQEWLAAHPDAPFHTADSVEAGIELPKKLARDGLVCVTAGDVGGQAFSDGLVDEIAMDVARSRTLTVRADRVLAPGTPAVSRETSSRRQCRFWPVRLSLAAARAAASAAAGVRAREAARAAAAEACSTAPAAISM